MALTVYELNDIITAVLFKDLKGKLTNLDPNLLRSYPYANRIVRSNVVRVQGGKDIRFDYNVDTGPAADNFGVYHSFTRTAANAIKQGTSQMKGTHSYFLFDVQEEEFNQGPETIIPHVKNREQNAEIALVKKIESQGWDFAASTDNLTPQGFQYHLPFGTGTPSFQGTYPSGYSDYQGLSTTTYTALKSWCGDYAAVTDADLVDKIDTAMTKTRFMSPLTNMMIQNYSTGWDWALYCRYETLKSMKSLGKSQNDDLGFDLDPANGRMTFRGITIEDVPYLENDTRYSFLGVNWGVTKHYVKSNWWMKRMKAPGVNEQPLVTTWDIFCMHQLVILDRRTGGFRLHLAA